MSERSTRKRVSSSEVVCLRAALEEVADLREDAPAGELFLKVGAIEGRVRSATEGIARAAAEGGAAPVEELREVNDAFDARWRGMRAPLGKLLHGVRELLRAALEGAMFVEMSGGASAGCGCAVWRAVANGGGLSAVPSFPSSCVVEEVNDAFESYRVHECGGCGSRWLQDFNPDSDPSSTRWWAR